MPQPIAGPADWRGPDLARSDRWIHRFTEAEIAEIGDALAFAKRLGRTPADLAREDFPLPTLSAELARTLDELENGPGLRLLRGFPAARYDKPDLKFIYWGLGLYLGTAVTQSMAGDVLGDVRDLGVDVNSARGRGYTSSAELSCHCDSCDVTGLFCLQVAREGGLSHLTSAVAVHNEMLRRRPDLVEVLYQPMYWSWQGQEPAGMKPYYQQTVFSMTAGRFASRYVRGHIRNAQAMPEVPRLTAVQAEALDLLDAIANSDEFRLTMMFEPGDIQFVNNHTMFHSRTEFRDWPEQERRRHLLRLWLSVPNSRPLGEGFRTFYRDLRPGAVRGGFPSRRTEKAFETFLIA